MRNIQVAQDGMRIPKIEYDVYGRVSGSNLKKLNLYICDNTKISLYLPINISENIDILNSSSGYYNDICFTATSETGTDITLKDRKNEFIEGNKTVCQEECYFIEYNYITNKANCLCKAKPSSLFFVDMKINKTKLLENFLDIKNIININILTCYKELFSKKGIKNNIGCFIIIAIILFHIICIYFFYMYHLYIFKIRIKGVFFGLHKIKFIKENEKERNYSKKGEKIIIDDEKNNNNKKEKPNNKNININERKISNLIEKKKSMNLNDNNNHCNNINKNKLKIKKNSENTENQTSFEILSNKSSNDNVVKEEIDKIEYNDDELNLLSKISKII